MEQRREKKPKQPWTFPRHGVVLNILRGILGPYTRLTYGVRPEPFREQGDRQYLVMMNHQTPFDQFFVGMSFRGPLYFIATEDIFSLGWVSRVIRYLVAPIPIKKQTTDLHAVMNCIKVAREGGTIVLAPEGNRTYSGKTEYIKPSIVKLARALKLPLAFYRIEGGYGVQPRWSNTIRKGDMRAYVARVVEPEEYAALDDDALYELICRELHVNEGVPGGVYRHKRQAEFLERAIYVCPWCGLSTFESHGDLVACKTCGRRVRHLPTRELVGEGFDFPFRFVNDWYEYQCGFVNGLDPREFTGKPLFRDTVRLSEVILYKHKRLIAKEVPVALYGDRVTVGEETYPFDDVDAVTAMGRSKTNLYTGGRVLQLKGGKRFNALKYVNFYYRYKNISEGNNDGKFLGL